MINNMEIGIRYQKPKYQLSANTFIVGNLMGIDLRLAYEFYKGIGAGVNINNILDEKHLVSNDQVSLGRFVIVEIFYKIH